MKPTQGGDTPGKELEQQMTNEELAERIKAGQSELMADLWNNCHKLLFFLMDRELTSEKLEQTARHGIEVEDLRQEMYFALVEAVKGFNPDAGLRFTTYLDYPVKNAINKALGLRGGSSAHDPLNSCTSIDAPVKSDEDDGATVGDFIGDPDSDQAFEEIAEQDYLKKLRADLERALRELPEQLEQTLRKRYFEGKTLDDVAEGQGISRQTVSNNEYSALLQLRETQILQSYRSEIIDRYSYSTGLQSFKNHNFTSSVELIVQHLIDEDERMKKRAHRQAVHEVNTYPVADSAPEAESSGPEISEAERPRKKWR